MNTTSPSTQYNLQVEVSKASIYVYPITVIVTLITNILNICVLCRRNLRRSSCTHYFLAFGLASLSYMCEVPVMMFLRLRFGFIVTSTSAGCRLQSSLIFVWPLFISIMLVLASVDRFLVSSSSVNRRNLSQVRFARRIIIITAIFDIVYGAPFLLMYNIDNKTNQCISYSSAIAVIYLSIRVVLSYIVVPLAMAIFGLLTIRNIRTQTRRIAAVAMNPPGQNRRRHRRTESQLARMLIIQVSAYIVFSTPAGVAYTLVTFIPSTNTSFMVGLRVIFSLWQQSIYFLTFFLYTLSSAAYRQELIQMFKFNLLRDQSVLRVAQLAERPIAMSYTNRPVDVVNVDTL